MHKTTLKSKLIIAGFVCSLLSQQIKAMEEDYSYTALLASSAIAGGIAYAFKYFCRNKSTTQDAPHDAFKYKDFTEWKRACDDLSTFSPSYTETALGLDELMQAVRSYTDYEMLNGRFLSSAQWLGGKPSDLDMYEDKFTPYAQKLIVSTDAEIAFHGDLHGDVHALNNFIANLNVRKKMNGFKIIDENFYMFFLGDYTDRGYYGAEVWYTILRLKLANPDRVFMVRGNHEDREQNQHCGFLEELQKKFGGKKNNQSFFELQRLYNFLPLAVYLGSGTPEETNYLLCCHGGLELGFNPKPLFQDPGRNIYTKILDRFGMLDRSKEIGNLSDPVKQAVKEKVPACLLSERPIDQPVTVYLQGKSQIANQIGFMWNDHIINPEDIVDFMNGRGWLFGKRLTQETLALHSTPAHKLRGIFRAHQHGDLEMMKHILNKNKTAHPADTGISKLWPDHTRSKTPQTLWDGIVCTFLVAPEYFGKIDDCPFDYDAFGLLRMAPNFDDWKLETVRLPAHEPNRFQIAGPACSSSTDVNILSDLFDE